MRYIWIILGAILLVVETASLEAPTGKNLAHRYDIQVFPAYIFAAGLARSPRFERMRDLAAAVQTLADSLQLAPGTISALIGNQVLIRHAQPGEIFRLWREGNQL